MLNYARCFPWPIMQALCYLNHKPIGSITNVLGYRADCNSKFSYVYVVICSLMMSVQSHDLLVTFYFPNRLGDEQM